MCGFSAVFYNILFKFPVKNYLSIMQESINKQAVYIQWNFHVVCANSLVTKRSLGTCKIYVQGPSTSYLDKSFAIQ